MLIIVSQLTAWYKLGILRQLRDVWTINVIDRTRELLIDLDYTLQPIVILKKDGTKRIICYKLLVRSLKDMKVPLELLKLVSMSEQANTLFLGWKRAVLRQVIKK